MQRPHHPRTSLFSGMFPAEGWMTFTHEQILGKNSYMYLLGGHHHAVTQAPTLCQAAMPAQHSQCRTPLRDFLLFLFIFSCRSEFCCAHSCTRADCPKPAERCIWERAAADGIKQAALLVETVNAKEEEHNRSRKYGNEPLPQQHSPVVPTVLSFQLLEETGKMELVLYRGR